MPEKGKIDVMPFERSGYGERAGRQISASAMICIHPDGWDAGSHLARNNDTEDIACNIGEFWLVEKRNPYRSLSQQQQNV